MQAVCSNSGEQSRIMSGVIAGTSDRRGQDYSVEEDSDSGTSFQNESTIANSIEERNEEDLLLVTAYDCLIRRLSHRSCELQTACLQFLGGKFPPTYRTVQSCMEEMIYGKCGGFIACYCKECHQRLRGSLQFCRSDNCSTGRYDLKFFYARFFFNFFKWQLLSSFPPLILGIVTLLCRLDLTVSTVDHALRKEQMPMWSFIQEKRHSASKQVRLVKILLQTLPL